MQVPLAELLDQLPLSALGREALQGSRPAHILETVRRQDHGDLASLPVGGLTAQTVFLAWYEAVRRADNLIRAL